MKTLLISLAALTLLGCDVKKRHQRLVRKHPHLLELIIQPIKDTIRIDNTKQIECPDGTIIEVPCDTIVVYETNNVALPPTNAQIRQQERTKRNFEDNLRKKYSDSLDHVKQMYKLENQRLKNENKELRKNNKQLEKTKRTETRQASLKWWEKLLIGGFIFVLLFLAAIILRFKNK